MAKSKSISTSSTAEYFAKNLQQVGFSSPTKAVLTTLKEAVDNALDACEEVGILPDIFVEIQKMGKGNLRNTDRVRIVVSDNGPGISAENVPKVFGEYLASSKFGRGRCSRGQQGIGISAATTWAIQTTATGVKVTTKMKNQRKALRCMVATDLKKNKGIVQKKEQILWDQDHGTAVEFLIDGRIQLNGEAGIINYLRGNVLLNPHLTLTYLLPDVQKTVLERVTNEMPRVPEATSPHPHTMKLGEFMTHSRLFGRISVKEWLKKGFSRMGEKTIDEVVRNGKIGKSILSKSIGSVSEEDFIKLFVGIQQTTLMAPPTSSVMSVGEEGLALSVHRLGHIDYFSVVSRKPIICDYKPVQVEVAVARFEASPGGADSSVQVLRFANRVPLQFDKASCAIVKAINSINWKTYGLKQSKGQMPVGPYVMAVSVVSPFIKFKNASKETIDASDDLVEEIRRALMKAGQRLSKHLRREHKADELELKIKHIEKFAPILVQTLCKILGAPDKRRDAAELGLRKILGRETKEAEKQLSTAEQRLQDHLATQKHRLSTFSAEDDEMVAAEAARLERHDFNRAQESDELSTSLTEGDELEVSQGDVQEDGLSVVTPRVARKASGKKAVETATKKAVKKTSKKAAKKTAKKTAKKAVKKTSKKAGKKTGK